MSLSNWHLWPQRFITFIVFAGADLTRLRKHAHEDDALSAAKAVQDIVESDWNKKLIGTRSRNPEYLPTTKPQCSVSGNGRLLAKTWKWTLQPRGLIAIGVKLLKGKSRGQVIDITIALIIYMMLKVQLFEVIVRSKLPELSQAHRNGEDEWFPPSLWVLMREMHLAYLVQVHVSGKTWAKAYYNRRTFVVNPLFWPVEVRNNCRGFRLANAQSSESIQKLAQDVEHNSRGTVHAKICTEVTLRCMCNNETGRLRFDRYATIVDHGSVADVKLTQEKLKRIIELEHPTIGKCYILVLPSVQHCVHDRCSLA